MGSVVVAVGVFGVVTGYQSHDFWKWMYGGFLLILIVVCVGLIMGVFTVRERLNRELYSVNTCLDVKALSEADAQVKNASQLLCSDTCPCNNFYHPQKVKGSAISILTCRLCESNTTEVTDYVATLGGENYCKVNAGGKPEDFTEHYSEEKWTDYIGLMTWAEENLDCAGVCSPETYYTFSDVNRGLPETDCRTRFRSYASNICVTIGGILALMATWMLVVFIISVCVRIHKTNRTVSDLESPLNPKND